MKTIWILTFSLIIISQAARAQDYTSNPQALRIVDKRKTEKARQDSLRKAYVGKWTLNIGFGNRYIDRGNLTDLLDTASFADFSKLRGYLHLGAGKFVSNKLWVNLELSLAMPARNQDVVISNTGNNGISIEGEGSGGLMMGAGLVAKYYYHAWGNARLYAGGGLGTLNLIAKGGQISFNSVSGRSNTIEEASARYFSSHINTGITLRPSKIFLFDLGLAYSFTSTDEPVGRIVSPGGFSTAFTLSFILGANRF